MPQSASLVGSEGAKSSSLRVINQGFQREFALVAGNGDYDLATEHSFTVLSPDGSKMPWYSSLVSADRFANLTLKKIPKMVLSKCEWGHDDYSLNVENLPMQQKPKVEPPRQGGLFGNGEEPA